MVTMHVVVIIALAPMDKYNSWQMTAGLKWLYLWPACKFNGAY